MPEYFESNTLINTDVLERLNGPNDDATATKNKLLDHIPKRLPLHMETLMPGNQYQGLQISQSHRYHVTVKFQDVDINESYLSGYLTIEGLTDEYPSLTTFFEAEIIGKQHRFQTRKWDATLETDIEHWSKFENWRKNYQKYIYDDTVSANPLQDDHIFMRWKEQFLVPDHRITSVAGASYSGFYYTCMDLATGEIDGYYFHNNSEKFQRISLECDRKDYSAVFEYR